ncbi:MAG: bifunctional tetrahydrofolate synthase/dihydrofolate synthase [Nevskia sp.]|nr:bifunctional tetrahydrofolate synthase/dihydrofolate synthase [Nevskia sp.]
MTLTDSVPRSLADWLAYQERVHPRAIELGLERVRAVALRLGLLPAPATTLTVGGTNGKGSSATLAAGIYRQAGYRVGLYRSPHLLVYNERVELDGAPAADAQLCRAFAAIEQARGDIPLTYFEFGTLAALLLFREASVQVQVLEVGLGGRLDAVNIVDADCALVTNIGLDHTDWLGPDRDSIAYEKAGILRGGRPAVTGEAQPPARLLGHAQAIGADIWRPGQDYRYRIAAGGGWDWSGRVLQYRGLPAPALAGDAQYGNAAAVLAAVEALQGQRPVAEPAIRAALAALRLPGRFEVVGDTVLDVAHNVEAAQVLAHNLQSHPVAGRTWLVLGMFADKPAEGVCAALTPVVSAAFFGGLPPPRGLGGEDLRRRAAAAGLDGTAWESVEQAYARARAGMAAGDRIVVCGSFLSVAAVAKMLTCA